MKCVLTKKRTPKCHVMETGYKFFSNELSQQRIFSIQKNLHNKECLLCISGIDSNFDTCNFEFCNYLLFNVFSKRNIDFEKTGYEDEFFEDVIICIGSSKISVYLNPVNYWIMLPYIASWPGLSIFCIEDEKFSDSDLYENYKLQSLIQMSKDYENVYIPTALKETNFDVMYFEKWPIIQAFAVQDYGVGTFFTLKFNVKDGRQLISDVIHAHDWVTIEELLNKCLSSFSHQFYDIYNLLDFQFSKFLDSSTSADITFDQLMEPLVSYQKHLFTTHPSCEKSNITSFLTFQTDSSHVKKLLNLSTICQADDIASMDSSHVLIQSYDSVHKLGCVRTYMLHSTSQLDTSCGIELGLSKSLHKQESCRQISMVYESLVLTVHTAINNYTSTLSWAEFCDNLKQKIASTMDSSEATVEIVTESDENKCSDNFVAFVAVYLMDIRKDGVNLGSVAFGNTYFIRDGTIAQNLTESIPVSLSWETMPLNIVERSVQHRVGARMLDATVNIITHTSQMSLQCLMYERHVILYHPRHGSSIISLEVPVQLYEGENVHEPAFLRLPLNAQQLQYVSQHLLCNSNVYIQLESGTKAMQLFYSKILGGWKSDKLVHVMEKFDFILNKQGLISDDVMTRASSSITTDEDNSFVVLDSDIVLMLVWGHFGSYADTVAYQLSRKLPAGSDGSFWRMLDLQHILTLQELRKSLQQLTQQDNSRQNYIVLCPFGATARQVSECFDEAVNIQHCLTCINSDTVVAEGKCLFQCGVLDSLAEDWCTAVVLTTPEANPEGSEEDKDAQIKRFYSLINQQRRIVISAPMGDVKRIEEFLTPELPKRSNRPQKSNLYTALFNEKVPEFIKLEFHQPLERTRLTERLHKTNSSSGHSLFKYIQGHVIFKSNARKITTIWHSTRTKHTGWGSYANDVKSDKFVNVVAFYGNNLNVESLKNFLRLCAPPKPVPKSKMIVSDLTRSVIDRIHKLRRLDPLPEGWFFNGTHYVCMDGEKSLTHPTLQDFLQEFVDEQNVEIKKYNSSLKTDSWKDLFAE